MPLADQLLAVGFVLCLAAAAAWMLRRGRGMWVVWPSRRARAERTLRVLEQLPLTGQHALHLVRVGERTVLVGTHPGGLVMDSSSDGFPEALAMAARRQSRAGGGE